MKSKKDKILIIKIGNPARDLEDLKNPKNVDSFPENVVYFKSTEQLASVLSQKKLELLEHLSEITGETVTKIATELGRKKEAVSRELNQLDSLGFIEMGRQGNKAFPRFEYEAIQINLKKQKSAKKAYAKAV